MRLLTAECSSQGGRKYNEDSICIVNEASGLMAVVADGLGGHGGGQIASSLAVNTIIEMFNLNPELNAANIQGIFESANQRVLAAQTPECQMKSTGVALFIKDNTAIWAHAGDSRLYHFMEGKLAFQTKDHSVSQLAVLSGEIAPSQIRFHEDRNRVLRAFGNDDNIKTEISTTQMLDKEFHAFLLCSDGFWEYVLEEEMEIDLAKSITPDEWLSFMLQRLGNRVDGTNDNFTAAAVFVIK